MFFLQTGNVSEPVGGMMESHHHSINLNRLVTGGIWYISNLSGRQMVRLYNINRSFHCYAEIFFPFQRLLPETLNNIYQRHLWSFNWKSKPRNVLKCCWLGRQRSSYLTENCTGLLLWRFSWAIPHNRYRWEGVSLPTVPFVLHFVQYKVTSYKFTKQKQRGGSAGLQLSTEDVEGSLVCLCG